MALHKYQLQPSVCSLEDIASSLKLVPDLIGKIGGDTNQVTRCQKIIHLLLQPTSAIVNSMQGGSSNRCPPQDEGATRATGEELQSVLHDPFFGSFDEIGTNAGGFADLDSFTDELSTLFPGGL